MADELELSNTQLIMIVEIKDRIDKLKAEGKSYLEIRKAIITEYLEPMHWCVTERRKREMAIGAALYTYAMNDKQRKAVKIIKDMTGQAII